MPNKPPRYRPTAARRPAPGRPSAAARGYDHAWERFRSRVLADDGTTFPEGGPHCRDCLDLGLTVDATDVDHKTPFRGDRALKFDPANVRSLCHPCHSKKTARCDRPSLPGPGA